MFSGYNGLVEKQELATTELANVQTQYQLPTEQFRLYYTSTSSVSQSFDVWISDSFGNEKQISFQFNSSD
jgi:hypothetical protein